MKIGLILPGFSASESDWCIPAILDLVRSLAGRAEVHVFALRYPSRRHPYDVYRARVHPQAGGTVGGVRRVGLLGNCVSDIVGEHRRGPFDLLHAFWADEPGFVAVVAAGVILVPAVVSLAGGELVRYPELGYGSQLSTANRWMTRIALHRAAHVTAGSTYLARVAGQIVAPTRLSVWPLGVDTQRFQSAPARVQPALFDSSQVNVANVASLVPIKRQVDLLHAVARVVPVVPAIHLHFIGDGLLREELCGQVDALGIGGHVTFHGEVSHDHLPAFYQAADMCVLSSLHEAQGMVTLEAASCGRTTLGTSVGILPDLEPATCAVAAGDVPALAEKMIVLANSAQLRAELGSQALAAVRSQYSLPHTVNNLFTLYDAVLGRKREVPLI